MRHSVKNEYVILFTALLQNLLNLYELLMGKVQVFVIYAALCLPEEV